MEQYQVDFVPYHGNIVDSNERESLMVSVELPGPLLVDIWLVYFFNPTFLWVNECLGWALGLWSQIMYWKFNFCFVLCFRWSQTTLDWKFNNFCCYLLSGQRQERWQRGGPRHCQDQESSKFLSRLVVPETMEADRRRVHSIASRRKHEKEKLVKLLF